MGDMTNLPLDSPRTIRSDDLACEYKFSVCRAEPFERVDQIRKALALRDLAHK